MFSFVAGNSAAKTLWMFNIIIVACISESTYHRHIKSYVNPTIIQQWKAHQQHLFNSLSSQDNQLVLAGDGRNINVFSYFITFYYCVSFYYERVRPFQLLRKCYRLKCHHLKKKYHWGKGMLSVM